MKVLAIFLLAVMVVIQTVPSSGLKYLLNRYPMDKQFSENMDERIFGGTTVTDARKYPHQVWILMVDKNNKQKMCGGSIIALNKILTAAHCVEESTSFTIGAGDIYVDFRNKDQAEQKISSTTVKIHPSWDFGTLTADIAIITLPKPFNMTAYVKPIALDDFNTSPDNHAGELTTITGYGWTTDSSGPSRSMQEVDGVPVIANSNCYGSFEGLHFNDGLMCIDSAKRKSSCQGDSGGPMIIKSQGTPKQIGIVSAGSDEGCTNGTPALFTRISYYRKWINKNM